MLFTTPIFWILAGVLLILSELIATSVVAVFLGIGAIVTGIATETGLISSAEAQYITFSVVSLLSLLLARKRLSLWFRGRETADGHHAKQVSQYIGQSATVLDDFQSGSGRVVLNGVQWDARAADATNFTRGQRVFIVENEGITLIVTAQT